MTTSRMQFPDPGLVAAIMRDTAEEVILPRFKSLAEHEVSEKTGPDDLVTIADTESERRMAPLLEALLPGSVVLGEEAVAADPGLFSRLDGDDPVWVVDPVDGTKNFAKGNEKFCVMVSLVWRGATRLGVILDPLGERFAAAEEGAGVRLHGYDGWTEPPRELKPAPAAEMEGALNMRFLDSPMKEEMRARAKGGAVGNYFSLGCAGHEYLWMLTGRSQFAFYVKNMPWDHAAGCLMMAEAGAHIARFDGRPYKPAELEGGIILAPDRESWADLRARLWGED